jgi:hypothetical protein
MVLNNVKTMNFSHRRFLLGASFGGAHSIFSRTDDDGYQLMQYRVALRGVPLLHKTSIGGWGGIRTHGELAPTPVFKTGALNRSATHPLRPF